MENNVLSVNYWANCGENKLSQSLLGGVKSEVGSNRVLYFNYDVESNHVK